MNLAEQHEEVVFEAALKLPAEQRAAYLNETCAGDANLRRRVEVLLGAFERAGGFMKEAAVSTPGQTARFPLPPTEKPGDRIGHYKLLEQIGEGGCGVVYVAEQEEPVRRRAEAMHGTLNLQSAPREGTTVRLVVDLPKAGRGGYREGWAV